MKGRVETVVKKSEKILRDRTPTKVKIVEVENVVHFSQRIGGGGRSAGRSGGRSGGYSNT